MKKKFILVFSALLVIILVIGSLLASLLLRKSQNDIDINESINTFINVAEEIEEVSEVTIEEVTQEKQTDAVEDETSVDETEEAEEYSYGPVHYEGETDDEDSDEDRYQEILMSVLNEDEELQKIAMPIIISTRNVKGSNIMIVDSVEEQELCLMFNVNWEYSDIYFYGEENISEEYLMQLVVDKALNDVDEAYNSTKEVTEQGE